MYTEFGTKYIELGLAIEQTKLCIQYTVQLVAEFAQTYGSTRTTPVSPPAALPRTPPSTVERRLSESVRGAWPDRPD